MRRIYFLALFLAVALSCKKVTTDYPPFPTPSFVDLKLKDITIRNLPSPYYHFEYDNNYHISAFSFSQLWTYDMSYTGNYISLMKGSALSANKDSVKYMYDNDRLINITVTSDAGDPYRKATLNYYPSGQLQSLEWELKIASDPFKKENSMTFSYYDDGNVKEIVQHYFVLGSITQDIVFTDTYSNYDHQTNVDGFSLVHTSQFKHPILLPRLTIQANNAGRVVRTGGAATNYEVNYRYTYDNTGRPLTQTGDFVATNGANAGQHVQLLTTYSYYN